MQNNELFLLNEYLALKESIKVSLLFEKVSILSKRRSEALSV